MMIAFTAAANNDWSVLPQQVHVGQCILAIKSIILGHVEKYQVFIGNETRLLSSLVMHHIAVF